MENERLILFEQYTFGQLTLDETKDFESRLESDEEFKKEFEEFIHLVNGVNEFERERLKELLKNSKVGIFHMNHRRKSMLRFVSAAAVVLILLIPTLILYRQTTYKPRLVIEYYIKDPGLPVTMGASVDPLLDKAMIGFKDGNFEQSLNIINELLVSKPMNDTLNYYAGICYYEMQNSTEAIEHFKRLNSKESVYFYQAKYDLGLTYIKVRDIDDARTALKEVASDDSGPLKANAKKILEKL